MMKKKYIKPEMQVYEVGTQQLLAGSPGDPGYYGSQTPGDNNEGMW